MLTTAHLSLLPPPHSPRHKVKQPEPPTRHRDRKLNDVSQEGNDVCGVDDWRCWCGGGGDGEALIRRGGSQTIC